MYRIHFRAIAIITLLAVSVFIAPQASFAGGLKEKMQKRLNEPINIQFNQGAPVDMDKVTGDQGAAGYYVDSYEAQETKSEVRREGESRPGGIGGGRDRKSGSRLRRAVKSAVSRPESSIIDSIFSSYAIYQTNYKAELEDNVVTVKGKVVFQVFKQGWTQLPLVKSSVGLIDVSINRSTAFVIMEGGKYYLMIDKPGKYTLNIEFLIKASREREGGPGSFSFGIMAAPISQFEFEMPEEGVEIFVEPAIKVEVEKKENKTIAWAIMPNTNIITTRWTKALPKETIKKVQVEPKIYAETATYASIGEGVVRCETRYDYSILQSEVSNFRIAIPEDVSLLDVRGRDLRDWKITAEEGIQYLDVYLNYGVKGKYALDLIYERGIGDGSVVADIPSVKAVGAEREKGYFGVAARTNVELAVNNLEKVTSIDVKELPSSIWSKSSKPILLAFKYINHPFLIAIDVTRHEELPVLAAAVDNANYVTLYTEEGQILTKVTYQVKNTSEQFLRFSLPKGSTLWSTFVSGKPVKPADGGNGSILIPLQKSQLQGETLTRFPVEIVYLNKDSEMKTTASLKVELPKISLPISEIFWSVYCPSNYMYFNFGGNVKQAKRAPSWGRQVQRVASSPMRALGDIATQQVAGKMMYSKEESQRPYKRDVLPIKIDIPQKGKLFRFSKLLVAEKESPYITMKYVRVYKHTGKIIKFLIIFLVVFLIVKGIGSHSRKKKEQKENQGNI